VWEAEVGGRRLTFHLDGINNQNFVMRDDQTGSWWQQASGEAFLGPLRGSRLRPVFADEIAFAIWRHEHPAGRVLQPVAGKDGAWKAFSAAWEADTARLPVTSAAYDTARAAAGPADPLRHLPPRTLVLGVSLRSTDRAYPLDVLRGQGVVMDDLGGAGIAILAAADGRSLRVFESMVDGRRLPLFLEVGAAAAGGAPAVAPATPAAPATAETPESVNRRAAGGSPAQAEAPAAAAPAGAAPAEPLPRRWIDGISGSVWDFSGQAVSGPWQGRRLRPVAALKDYWFDWQTYHPHTSVYLARPRGGG
jgi:hypothetical protein